MKTQSVINLQAKLYDSMPDPLKQISDGFRYVPNYLQWRYSNNGYEQAAKLLSPLSDKFAGCRCVIIGNGPSLQKMDLSILRNEYTFGLNRIYLLFDKLGFATTFLVSINRLVLQQSAQEIEQIKTTKFLNWNYHKFVKHDTQTAFLCPRPGLSKADGQILNGYYARGGTVTNVAIELAYFMGFSEVILIGIDHSFVDKGTPNKIVVSQGADPNHFAPNYFGKGYMWQLPDLQIMEQGYQSFRRLFDNNGRKIVDATLDGKLQVFSKVNFEEYLAQSNYHNQLSAIDQNQS